ncbi:MAG TPA: beta family protein [Myxococcales bacterium]|jgi:hypothetical protein
MNRSDLVYVPILKAKAGEFSALKSLSVTARRAIMPLLDIQPIPWNWKEGAPAKTPEAHLDSTAKNIAKVWKGGTPILVDFFDLPLKTRTTPGTHPVDHLLHALHASSVDAIPTVGLDRDTAFEDAVGRASAATGGRVAIRLLEEDISSAEKTCRGLRRLLAASKSKPGTTSLLLDFRGLDSDRIDDASERALEMIAAANRLGPWAQIVVAASGMAKAEMSQITTNSEAELERVELSLWKNIILFDKSKRRPLFGDYGIVDPEFADPKDPRTLNPSAKIRYTLGQTWIVLKGHSYKSDPEQFHRLASSLQSRKEYWGLGHSWGDDYIYKCARKQTGPGNLTTWVGVDTSHHLEFVSSQIANLLAA